MNRDLRRAASALLLIPGLMACSPPEPGPTDAAVQPPVAAPGAPAAPGGPPPVAGQAAAPGSPGAPPAPGQANARAGTAATVRPAPAPAATGLVTLPSAQQVITALPLGRRDPFASSFPSLPAPASASSGVPPRYRNAVPAALAGRAPAAGAVGTGGSAGAAATTAANIRLRLPPAPLVPPEGFRVTGLIRAGRVNEAVVQFQDLSGSLRRGDRGGLTTDLLPPGWSVAAVDVNQGRVILARGRRQVVVDL